MQSFVRPESLTELVTRQLRTAIVSGELEMGEHLSETRIAKDLNVSRTPAVCLVIRTSNGFAMVCPRTSYTARGWPGTSMKILSP